jgi:hypothetical protein
MLMTESLCKLLGFLETLEFVPIGRAENFQWEECRGARDSSFFRTKTPNCWI